MKIKNLFMLALWSLVTVSVSAQENALIKAGSGLGTQSDIALKISQKIKLPASRVVLPLAFMNVPAPVETANHPFVPSVVVVPPQEVSKLTILPGNIVQGTALSTKYFNRHMPEFDDLDLYSLVAFRENGASLYRGMVLRDLYDLKNILINGLEVNKTRYDRIFTTPYLSAALDYAANNYGYFPVIVQLPETNELLSRPHRRTIDEIFLYGDIAPEHISHVMVFMKIGEKPGWYDVVWQEDKLVFSHVPTDLDEILEVK